MKGDEGIWLEKNKGKGVRSFNRDVIVFAFFLLLSFVLWYLNSLKKEIDLDLRYPVRYVNPPKDRIIGNELPARLNLSMKGPGYSIIKLRISGNRAPLIVDFSKVAYKRVAYGGRTDYYVVSNSLIQTFSKQLRSEFQIQAVKPDTLFVKFDRKTATGSPGKNSTGK